MIKQPIIVLLIAREVKQITIVIFRVAAPVVIFWSYKDHCCGIFTAFLLDNFETFHSVTLFRDARCTVGMMMVAIKVRLKESYAFGGI